MKKNTKKLILLTLLITLLTDTTGICIEPAPITVNDSASAGIGITPETILHDNDITITRHNTLITITNNSDKIRILRMGISTVSLPIKGKSVTIPMSSYNIAIYQKTNKPAKNTDKFVFKLLTYNKYERNLLPLDYLTEHSFAKRTKETAEMAKRVKKETVGETLNALFNELKTYTYDNEKQKNIKNLPVYWLPDNTEFFIKKGGICFETAAAITAILHECGIPAKTCAGRCSYVEPRHAWNKVLIDGKWKIIDWSALKDTTGFYPPETATFVPDLEL